MRRRLAIILAVMITVSALPAVEAAAVETGAGSTEAGSTAVDAVIEAGEAEAAREAEAVGGSEEAGEGSAETGSTADGAEAAGEETTSAGAETAGEAEAVGGSEEAGEGSAETGSTADGAEVASEGITSAGAETADGEGTTSGGTEAADGAKTAGGAEATGEAEAAGSTEEAAAAGTESEAAGVIEEIIEEPEALEVSMEAKGAVNSFVNIDGKKYYYDAEGKKLSNKWLTFGDFTYYIGADGAACTGFKKIGGRTYYFKDSRGNRKYPVGAMELGWQKIGSMKFYFADGGYPAIGDKYPGAMLTGWRRIGGNMYYFADTLYPTANRGRMMDGWRTISGRKYYFGTNGVRRTGFQTIGGKTYYFADSQYSEYTSSKQGVMLKAIKKIGGKYYFFSDYGVMKTGWINYKGVLGYYNADGTAVSGWQKRWEDWYYLKENGIARTGWLILGDDSVFYMERAKGGRMVDEPQRMSNGKMYFFDSDGRRATSTGWRNYGKYYYYTYSNGTCAENTEIDGVWLDEDGRTEMTAMDIKAQGYYSSTNYLILVDRSIHKVGIYKGRQGNWINIKRYSCGDGKASTPTIEGNFTVGIKLWYFDSGSARCWYATQFSGNYLFHSVLYYQNSYPADVMDGTLGAGVSHGCVRLEVSNARWIYDNIPRGTKVVVYH